MPDARTTPDPSLAAGVSDPVAQHNARPESLGADKNEGRSSSRLKVCIIRRGTRLLDVDNGCGGCKALLDAIRYENLIVNDDPSCIDFEFRQEKVKHPFTGTEILISPV